MSVLVPAIGALVLFRDDPLTRDEMHEFAENGETTGNGQN
jgi:hypothetical protein